MMAISLESKKVMAVHVNLDALVPREDFDESSLQTGKKSETFKVEDLDKLAFFYSALRKPDFQRETNEWDVQKIVDFVKSFVSGDLIPAIILWKSANSYTFVIDGSHRISALAAWRNDDYGDGEISKAFFDGIIPEEQLEIGEKTRAAIRKSVGSFKDHQLALSSPDKVKPEICSQAKNLGTLAIQLQWVEGDSKKAEQSFQKINEQGVPINATEKKILASRSSPVSISARAIIKGGKGHNYWSKFPAEVQQQLCDIAKESNSLLFSPRLKTPVKNLELPLAGKAYASSALPLVIEPPFLVQKECEVRG